MTRVPLIAEIKAEVAREFDVTVADLEGPARQHDYTIPRHIAFQLCRNFTSHSLPRIGNVFGKRDHTTVMSGIANLQKKLAKNPELRFKLKAITARLNRLAARDRYEEEANG